MRRRGEKARWFGYALRSRDTQGRVGTALGLPDVEVVHACPPPFQSPRSAGHHAMPIMEEGAAVLENGDRRLERRGAGAPARAPQRVARARERRPETWDHLSSRAALPVAVAGVAPATAHLVEKLVRHAACGKRPSGKRACASRKRPPGPEFNSVSI